MDDIIHIKSRIYAHVHVQNQADVGLGGKLRYKARGLLIITKYLGNNSVEAQQNSTEDSIIRWYSNTGVCLLPAGPASFRLACSFIASLLIPICI